MLCLLLVNFGKNWANFYSNIWSHWTETTIDSDIPTMHYLPISDAIVSAVSYFFGIIQRIQLCHLMANSFLFNFNTEKHFLSVINAPKLGDEVIGDSWYFRLVYSLQRSQWNANQFVNLFNQLVHVHCLEWNKVSCSLSSCHFCLFVKQKWGEFLRLYRGALCR